jgi:hypothetical protein
MGRGIYWSKRRNNSICSHRIRLDFHRQLN